MRLTCRDSDIGNVIGQPADARAVFLPMMLPDRETLVVMLLDDHRRVITAFVAATGTATQVSCEMPAIFRPAVLLGATYILIAHNHPNGDTRPSDADILTTKMIEAGSALLGIGLIDHLILTNTNGYRSIIEYMYGD